VSLLTNLVAYWKLDEASGNRADSHSTNTLTDNNTVASATGKIGLAADFEASNLESLSITNAAQVGLGFTSDFTVAGWLKFESLPGVGGYFNLFDKDAGPGARGFYSALRDAGAGNFEWMLMAANGLGTSSTAVSWNPSTGTWYHVAIVYTASAGSMKLYVNGALLGTGTGLRTSIQATTNPFYIGAVNGGGGQSFDGLIDELGAWTRVLDAADVASLYNGGSGITYPFSRGGLLMASY
jgi:hypothetical protein